MRVTAIRVSDDLWRLLEREAAQVGVSVSQYVREAALARASAAVKARGQDPFELLAQATQDTQQQPAEDPHTGPDGRARQARTAARDARSDAQAIRAESKQARQQARRQRDSARRRP
jgi:hypothetical protein